VSLSSWQQSDQFDDDGYHTASCRRKDAASNHALLPEKEHNCSKQNQCDYERCHVISERHDYQ